MLFNYSVSWTDDFCPHLVYDQVSAQAIASDKGPLRILEVEIRCTVCGRTKLIYQPGDGEIAESVLEHQRELDRAKC